MSEFEKLKKTIAKIEDDISSRVPDLSSEDSIEEFRVEFLGRNGCITKLFKKIGDIEGSDRAEAGKLLNKVKNLGVEAVEQSKNRISKAQLEKKLLDEKVDMSLPGVYRPIGHLHLLTQVQYEIESIFLRMGFDVATGPEIESEYYNFEALNIPFGHPARDEWDTFYIDSSYLLRPHTSPVQIRTMENTEPPVRIICPGRCYRRDSQDATHSPIFHQVELLWVEEGLSLANLKYMIELFVHEFFGEGYQMRLSGDFFPFTEPSVQMHMRGDSSSDWLELGGAGMVDPAVLSEVGYDPDQVSGFAFGLGIERMAMLRYGIEDIRTFLNNDLRFIRQF